jgi:hypothetical protein
MLQLGARCIKFTASHEAPRIIKRKYFNFVKSSFYMKVFYQSLFAVLYLMPIYAMGGKPVSVKQFLDQKEWFFVENKGQIATACKANGKHACNCQSEIKYYGHQGSVYLYCKPGIISFVFKKTEVLAGKISESTGATAGIWQKSAQTVNTKITSSQADLVLLHSNPGAEITATDQQEYLENFYTSQTPDAGIVNVHTYKTVIYKNIYPQIDMLLHTGENGVKYEFIVYPGGKASDIKMKWNGLKHLQKTALGGMNYALTLGQMEEASPVTYQGNMIVGSSFTSVKGITGFNTGKYDKTKPLRIDPFLSWATYYADRGGSSFGAVVNDARGNVYAAGSALSDSDLSTPGAYQRVSAGQSDVIIVKFNNAGKRIWATYYGGNHDEAAVGMAIDPAGDIYITGTTHSAGGMATNDTFKFPSYGGAFLAKFTGNGTRVWGTYFGGNITAVGTDVATDLYGNVFITGYTNSYAGIASKGAFQENRGGGDEDGYLAKFNSKGLFRWSTYYGGTGNDEPLALATDRAGNVFMTGSTQSDTGMVTKGSHQAIYGDSLDVFLAKFDSSGSRLWATYYGGTRSEVCHGMATDSAGDVYIAGITLSPASIASVGAYQTAIANRGNDFLAKFNSSGKRLWGTYYGGNFAGGPYRIALDISENVFVCGFTKSTTGMATAGAYQTKEGGGNDAYLAKFSPGGNKMLATLYGGPGDDAATGISVDRFGNVFIAGYAKSNSGIATSGAFQTARVPGLFGDNSNAFLAKFNFKINNDAGIMEITQPASHFCAGTRAVNVNLINYGNRELDSVKIRWTVNGRPQKEYHWKGQLKTDSTANISLGNYLFPAGNDTIRSWTEAPNGGIDSIPKNNAATVIDTVFPLPVPDWTMSNSAITTFLHATDSSLKDASYKWQYGDGDSATGHLAKHIYTSNKKYNVSLRITNKNGCLGKKDSLVSITVSGIDNYHVENTTLNIFPNPFNSGTTVIYNLVKTSTVSIYLEDLHGKEISVINNQCQVPGKYQYEIDADKFHLKAGVYLLKFTVDKEVTSRNIVKVN